MLLVLSLALTVNTGATRCGYFGQTWVRWACRLTVRRWLSDWPRAVPIPLAVLVAPMQFVKERGRTRPVGRRGEGISLNPNSTVTIIRR